MDANARIWFGEPPDTARAWGADPGPAPRWVTDDVAAVPFDDAAEAMDAFLMPDDDGAKPLDAEGVVAGSVEDDVSMPFVEHHSEVVPFYHSNDYMMFQANQMYLNAMYNTSNSVDYNLNGIVGY